MKIKLLILIGFIGYAILFMAAGYETRAHIYDASNFDRLVLGVDNFGEDPNPTADITGANDEYISNVSDGIWNFGAANLTTTGTITGLLSVGATVGDTNSFQKVGATNNEKFYDTVSISGSVATSVYLVSVRKSGLPVAGDLLAWSAAVTDKLIVQRADTTTTVEKYSWLKIK